MNGIKHSIMTSNETNIGDNIAFFLYCPMHLESLLIGFKAYPFLDN